MIKFSRKKIFYYKDQEIDTYCADVESNIADPYNFNISMPTYCNVVWWVTFKNGSVVKLSDLPDVVTSKYRYTFKFLIMTIEFTL